MLFAPAFIPFFGPLLCLLTPLPFLYYSTKLGFSEGIKLAVLSILVIGLFAELTGHHQIVLLGIELGIVGVFVAVLFKKRMGIGQTILLASAFMFLISLGGLYILGLSRDMTPTDMVLDYLYGRLKEGIEVYQEMGLSRRTALELETMGKAWIDQFYPSLMIIAVGFAAWFNVVAARPFFKKGGLKYPEFISMDRWQTPETMIWGVIVSGFTLFLLPGPIKILAANALMVLMTVYLFQGLSIILFFLNKYRCPLWIRIGVWAFILIQQLILLFLVVAGLFDQWIDFRKLQKESMN